jgi:heptosyltransferase II
MKKILVVGPSWVGDMVMTQSLFKFLKQQDSAVTIDVLAPAWSLGLLERMPEVSGSCVAPFGHGKLQLRQRFQLAAQLRSQHYDQVILIPNSFKSALAPFLARIPLRTGWDGEWPRHSILLNDARLLDKMRWPLMYQRFAALGLPRHADPKITPEFSWPKLTVAKDKLEPTLVKYELKRSSAPLLVLAPGAEFGPSKRWPPAHFAEVAKEQLNKGWEVWIFGSTKDQPVSKELNALTHNRCRDLTGKTTLAEAIDLISLADAVVSNDSGLMHIAAALERPLVALYGSTPHDVNPPLSHRYQSLFLDLSCRPCMKRECPLGHQRCMQDLKPLRVLESLNKLQDLM